MAARLLTSLTELLPSLTTLNEHDHRMPGKLELVLQLITALGNHALPSSDSQQLVHLLLTGVTQPCYFSHAAVQQALCCWLTMTRDVCKLSTTGS